MRVNDDYREVNAERQAKSKAEDQLSVLQFWKRALDNRKKHRETLVYGDFELLDEEHPAVFAYMRKSQDESFVIVLNFSGKHTVWDIPEKVELESWVAGNYTAGKPSKATEGKIALRPWEGLIGM